MNPIFKVLYSLYRLFSWAWHGLPRRFTRAGLAVLVAAGVCALMVPDTDNNVAYQAFTFLLSLLLPALLFAVFFKARFSAERLLPQFGTTGSPLTYTVLVRNLGRTAQSGLALLEDTADPRPSFREWLALQLADERQFRSFRFSQRRRTHPFRQTSISEGAVPTIASGQQGECQMVLTPLRRGTLRFHGLTFARPDPLGLLRSFIRVPLAESLVVLPKRYPLPPIALPGASRYQQGGIALSSSVGQSEEFVALRDYRHGDPLRHVHWRSWAKTGKPVVKEFEDEFFVRHALVLDTFAAGTHGDAFEEAVAIAASFACTLQTQESLLDLLFVGPEWYCFTSGRSLGDASQMLQVLASVRACLDQPFDSLENLVLSHVRVVSGCVCILLAWDEQRRSFIRKLRTVGLPVMVLVVVESEAVSGMDPGPLSDDPSHFHVLEVGQIEQQLAKLK